MRAVSIFTSALPAEPPSLRRSPEGSPYSGSTAALIDPADNYFPLERAHLTRMDLDEWRRTIVTAFGALRSGVHSLTSRTSSPKDLWEQLDRFYDSLPAGLFTLDAFERFLEEFFLRRGVSSSFPGLARPLRVVAHDLDSGDRVLFGAAGYDDVPLARACCASTALPLFYSPVRIRDRHYIDGGVGRVGHLDVAEQEGADSVVLINPMVPVRAEMTGVPTGHGARPSVRDKGLMWVYNQAMRIGVHARLHHGLDGARKGKGRRGREAADPPVAHRAAPHRRRALHAQSGELCRAPHHPRIRVQDDPRPRRSVD